MIFDAAIYALIGLFALAAVIGASPRLLLVLGMIFGALSRRAVGDRARGLNGTRALRAYCSAIAIPLTSRLTINPACWPCNCKSAPFSLRSVITRAPATTAAPAPTAP